MRRIDAAQGHLHRKFKSIHVAGTNGKGSVSHKIAAALQAEGRKVGLYTSPHIASFCERISINGQMIPEEAVEQLLPPILELGEGTFFEYATALAFAYFAEEEVDYAVLEVGLGGRCDATNVVHPILSIITSIHYDHMHLLGSTLEEIAQEKAGILKPGVPFVLGPRVPLEGGFRAPADASGFYDGENSSVAKLALEILNLSEEAIRAGLKVRPRCRFEILKNRFVLDVAHNPDGIEKLVSAANVHFPGSKLHYICAFSQDKDARQCIQILKNSGKVTCVGGGYPRLMNAEKLAALCPGVSWASNVHAALERVSSDEIALICGSFYIMADARKSIEGWESGLD
jgi:dihydrofolate synthase/folylpolyglutamate synthase